MKGLRALRLLILGAGQYGEVAREIAIATGKYQQIEFLDDNSKKAIGKLDEIDHIEFDEAIVAIGNSDTRELLTNTLGDKVATLIHPKAVVMPSCAVSKGCIVEAGAILCTRSTVGTGTIVMGNSVIGHDSKVGAYCQLKYNSTVSDSSSVPDKTKLDHNAVWR